MGPMVGVPVPIAPDTYAKLRAKLSHLVRLWWCLLPPMGFYVRARDWDAEKGVPWRHTVLGDQVPRRIEEISVAIVVGAPAGQGDRLTDARGTKIWEMKATETLERSPIAR